MLRKKQRLIQTRETTPKQIVPKVTVQYIQPQQRNVPSSPSTTNHTPLGPSTPEELEIESVEYLEETANSEDFIEEQPVVVKDEEYEDVFYPNAIHCLLDLYKEIYDKVIGKADDEATKVWKSIAKEMQESYFEFEADQIRQKYASLRQQYFEIKSLEDIENFDYFEELHQIYNDPSRKLIAKGGHVRELVSRVLYKDEQLMKAELFEEPQEEACPDFKSEEIVHKEHEFIDMVEKELQALNDAKQPQEEVEDQHKEVSMEIKICDKPQQENKTHEEAKNLKRPLSKAESIEEPAEQRPKQNEGVENADICHMPPSPPAEPNLSDPSYAEVMTLREYNVEQERRHREQMVLLGKQFQQHQMTLEHLNVQIQEIVKRLPLPL